MHVKNWQKPFIKIQAPDQQIVKGIVYEPDVVDTDDEKASAETIERACHKFNVLHRRMKIMHSEERKDILLLESYINPVDYQENGQGIRKGAWIIVVKVLDSELWDDIKTGKFTGFSMGGRAAIAQ
ncbi:hypothetical protein LCGC14_2383880 [marine sediment metagenome]|uniref:Phage-like element PBSX protein XkdF domain-containing protein n=1 Tax=marine sediment metagenome TaxID=412755 RepID=A0A0F9CM92_9ZZZZ